MGGVGMLALQRYVGIDYSGAQTPTSSLKGLRVYMANWVTPPTEVGPPPSPRKYWTRRGKSTHAGLPWLLQLRKQAGDRTHFWPFDGWRIPVWTIGYGGGLPLDLE